MSNASTVSIAQRLDATLPWRSTLGVIALLCAIDLGYVLASPQGQNNLRTVTADFSEACARLILVDAWTLLLAAGAVGLCKMLIHAGAHVAHRVCAQLSLPLARALVVTVVSGYGVWIISPGLAQGRTAQALLGSAWTHAGLVLGCALVMGACSYFWSTTIEPKLATTNPRAMLTLALLCLALVVADRNLLVGRYALIHGTLLLATSLGLERLARAYADRDGRQRPPRRGSTALIWVIGVALVGVIAPAAFPWDKRFTIHHVLTSSAPFGGMAHQGVAQVRWRLLPPSTSSYRRAHPLLSDAPLAADPLHPAGQLAPHVLLLSVDGLNQWEAGLDTSTESTPAIMPFLHERIAAGVYAPRMYTTYPATEAATLSLLSGTWWHERRPAPVAARASLLEDYRAKGYAIYCDLPFLESVLEKLHAQGLCDVELSPLRRSTACTGGKPLDKCELRLETPSSAQRVEWLNAYLRHESRPVLAWVHFLGPHTPYEHFHAAGDLPVLSDPYVAALRGTDAALRQIWQQTRGLARPSAFLFFADHGHAVDWHGLSGHHSSLYEDQIRVPLILDIPGQVPHRIERPISLIELNGLLRASATGQALAADLRAPAPGSGKPEPNPVFAFFDARGALVRGRYKLIEDPVTGSIELYDVVSDPQERTSLATSKPAILEPMLQELRANRAF